MNNIGSKWCNYKAAKNLDWSGPNPSPLLAFVWLPFPCLSMACKESKFFCKIEARKTQRTTWQLGSKMQCKNIQTNTNLGNEMHEMHICQAGVQGPCRHAQNYFPPFIMVVLKII